MRSRNVAYSINNRYSINESNCYIKYSPLTNKWISGFEAAKKAIGNPVTGKFMGAAIYSGNRLISVGNNRSHKTKPTNVVVLSDGSNCAITQHAEQSAIDKIKYKQANNKRLVLYVVRVTAAGKFVVSRPCAMCIDYMKKWNISLVRFINKDGLPEEIKLMPD
jgi:tRNA(Arg) A34 adenosine deaminase TadA